MLITLPLYVLKELGKSLLSPFLVYTFIILPFFLFQMARQNVGVWTMVSIIPMIFPFIAGYVLPPTILTGTVMAYGKLKNDNEYTAAIAGGVRPGWILLPALLVGIIATFASLYLNESVLTRSAIKIGERLVAGQMQQLEQKLDRRGVVRMGAYHLYRFPENEEGNRALDMTIYETPPSSDEIRATTGSLDKSYSKINTRFVAKDHHLGVRSVEAEGHTNNTIVLSLDDCNMQLHDENGKVLSLWSEEFKHELKIKTKLDSRIRPDSPRCMGISKLRQRIRERQLERADKMAMYKEKLAQKEISQEKFGEISAEIDKDFQESMGKYRGEIHSRLGLSFACLLFAVTGMLLGLLSKHSGGSSRFLMGFTTAGSYFIFFIFCRALSEYGAWILWMPNLILLGITVYLWRRNFWIV
ncbi:MAG: LptF/LptG family permease [Planctomycetes bacterium]|nr:LptF/LptG family permease [Planctomycetota bacterium]